MSSSISVTDGPVGLAGRPVNVNEAFDNVPFSPYQVWICCLCFCVVLFDGFDLTVIGVALPGIADYLKVGPGELGLAVSAGQTGPLIGAVILGMVADRIGRKKTIVASALVFGFFTYMTVHITSVQELALYRFLAGLGMGGVIPNALAYGSEYAPKRLRAPIALYMWAGMPFGSTIAAFAAAWLLPRYGWTSVFVVGGLAPIAIAAMMMVLMPESLHFLIRSGNQALQSKARAILSKIDKSGSITADTELTVPHQEKGQKGGSVGLLFKGGHAKTTIMMWVLFLLSFYLLWILFSWVPTLLRNSGSTPQQYSIGFGFIHMGSFIACLCIGTLMAKFGKLNVVKTLFVTGFFAMIGFGYFSTESFAILLPICIVTGMVVNGGNSSLMGVVTVVYPSEIRGAGIGWAYGIGKIGTLLAPAIGGLFLEAKWSVLKICAVNGVTALVIAALVLVLQSQLRATQEGEGW